PTNTTEGLVYGGEINSEDASIIVAPSDAIADICDSLVAVANDIDGVTATDNETDVDIAADTAQALVSFANLSEHYHVEDTTTVNSANLQADLNEILDEDGDWYGLALTINSA